MITISRNNEVHFTDEAVTSDLAQRKPSFCSCNECADMCKKCPCIGTPTEMAKLIEAGYRDKLVLTEWGGGLRVGLPFIKMVAPRQLENGHCIFLTNDNLCSLHDKGLKPSEGKLTSSHSSVDVGPELPLPTVFLVALTWWFHRFEAHKQMCFFYVKQFGLFLKRNQHQYKH